MITTNNLLEALVKEAKSNPCANAVFHVFAIRDRARSTIVIHSLYHKMKREGFQFSKEDYTKVIKFLASLELGVLDTDNRGKIRGLKQVRITLQSIGKAAIGQDAVFDSFRNKNKFSKLVVKSDTVPKPQVLLQAEAASVKSAPAVPKSYAVNLELIINGNPVHIPVPKELTTEDIAVLIGKLQH